jgi:hypothetical protein
MGFHLRGRRAKLKIGILTLGHVNSQRFFCPLHALQRHVHGPRLQGIGEPSGEASSEGKGGWCHGDARDLRHCRAFGCRVSQQHKIQGTPSPSLVTFAARPSSPTFHLRTRGYHYEASLLRSSSLHCCHKCSCQLVDRLLGSAAPLPGEGTD